jgi:peptide deformylase
MPRILSWIRGECARKPRRERRRDTRAQLCSTAMEILLESDERLRRPNSLIDSIDALTRGQIEGCFATLTGFRKRHGFGRALAAPQVCISRRLIAVDLGAGPFAVINPEIKWRSEEAFELWDDCFSVPDKLARVRRHRSISLSYRDEQFRLRRWERLPPDLSELLQHEIDHLDGVLMTDRALEVRPASERARLIDAGRPSRRLSLERIAEAARIIDPVFRNSPQFLCEALSEQLGCSLTLKVETVNPIRSFKGRGADFFVRSLAQDQPLVCASAGNFGQGLAYACRKRRIPLIVYAARAANPLKLERMRALSAEVRIAGDDFDAAKEAARQERGARMVEDGAIAAISEGAGSIAVELLARGEVYDTVLVPLGNGALLNGMARFIKAASPTTRVVGVCARGAPSMMHSFQKGVPVFTSRVETIADGIAVRAPIPEAVEDMRGAVDDVLLADDAAMVGAVRLLHRHTGLAVEPAGAAGLAAMLAAPGAFAGHSVATILCGGNVTPAQAHEWFGGGDK